MTDIFLERTFDTPLTADEVHGSSVRGSWCFELHNVKWRSSYLSASGTEMVCWFIAADAESVRLALRTLNSDIRRLWTGTVHEGPEGGEPNIVVQRSFAEPIRLEEIQAQEDAAEWCLRTHRVRFSRTFFSLDRTRMICFYEAPDSESVRLAQREARMPFDKVWAFQRLDSRTLQAYSG
jgi:hypothetical protein